MVITFKPHDDHHNRVAVETIFGVLWFSLFCSFRLFHWPMLGMEQGSLEMYSRGRGSQGKNWGNFGHGGSGVGWAKS